MNKIFNKNTLFCAKIVERYRLNQSSSQKNTYHIVLDLKGSNIQYKVGDSLAISPANDPKIVETILHSLNFSGAEQIINKKQQSCSLKYFLMNEANLNKISKKFFLSIVDKQTILEKKQQLLSLLVNEAKSQLDSFLERHEVWDFLLENNEISIAPQELCDLLLPLLPRFYSIASSMSQVGTEAHLTVALSNDISNGYERKGVCSHFLCELAPLHQPLIPLYLHPSQEFTLSNDSKKKPIIMIGPGTGVAPFRGFMQERLHQGATSKNWLFFGERHRHSDFFYEEYWNALTAQGFLKLDTAFSRDQEHKIYVQDCLRQNSSEIWDWLEQEAYLFVCGDASRMAKDVDLALQDIIQIAGKKDASSAKQYLKELKNQKRYLRDVY